MNILIVTPMYASYHNGGLGLSCQRIARFLSKKADKVRVVVFDCSQQYHQDIIVPTERFTCLGTDNVEIDFIPADFSYTGAVLPKKEALGTQLQQAYYLLREIAIDFKATCLISFFIMPYGYPCALISQEFTIPFIAGVRGNDVGRFMHDPVSLPLLQYIFRYSYATQVLANDLKNKVHFICPHSKRVKVIYNGIDPNPVLSALGNTTPPHELFTIGSVGMFKPKKGIEVLLRAFSRKMKPHWRLLLVGDFIKNETSLDSFYTDPERKEQVCLTGIVDRNTALKHLGRMDVFVAPTLSDGCPNATLEAMVARKPIVATRVSAMADILQDGDSGILMDYPNEERISAALEMLDDNKRLRRSLGESAFQKVRRLFPPYEEDAWCALLSSVCDVQL